ncbi:MAG TPA: hypothetical protein VF148_00650 [Acidimicrobiia bacterium]
MPGYEAARQLSPNINIQGGLQMFVRKGRLAPAECEHPSIVTVLNSGIERTVCETCGHVSFRGLEGLSGTADRRQFERIVERSGQPVG